MAGQTAGPIVPLKNWINLINSQSSPWNVH